MRPAGAERGAERSAVQTGDSKARFGAYGGRLSSTIAVSVVTSSTISETGGSAMTTPCSDVESDKSSNNSPPPLVNVLFRISKSLLSLKSEPDESDATTTISLEELVWMGRADKRAALTLVPLVAEVDVSLIGGLELTAVRTESPKLSLACTPERVTNPFPIAPDLKPRLGIVTSEGVQAYKHLQSEQPLKQRGKKPAKTIRTMQLV